MNNLHETMPRKAADMKRAWESWARGTGVQFQQSFSYYQMFNEYRKSRELEPDRKQD